MPTDRDQDGLLDRLNPTERELLSLLGRGHTAKSIATTRSLSEAAVNERFRAARRKTGVASSREIARLIVAQENRHDFIDLADPATSLAEIQRQGAPQSRRVPILRQWRFPMAVALLLATAIFVQQTSVSPSPAGGRTIPATTAPFEADVSSPNFEALHTELAAGKPDPVWSRATEAALSQAYDGIPAVKAAIGPVRVTCNASLCEAFGVSRPDLSSTEADAMAQAVQSRKMDETGARLKLYLIAMSISSRKDTSAPTDTQPTVLTAYWRRIDGR